MAFFGNRVIEDDLVKIRSLRWAPIHLTGDLVTRGNLDPETETQGDHHVKTGYVASIKQHQRLSANLQKLGEMQGTDSPSQPSEGPHSVDTLILAL